MQADPKLMQFPTCRFVKNIWSHFWTDLLKLEQDKSATATLWRPQMNQYTASNEGGGGFTKVEKQREHHIILT